MVAMRTDSTEYLTATVTADKDVTGSSIHVSVPAKDVSPSTWYQATVLSVAQVSNRWVATYRLLLGPVGGATQLAPGEYDWTVRITDSPEVPIRKAGTLTVTAT